MCFFYFIIAGERHMIEVMCNFPNAITVVRRLCCGGGPAGRKGTLMTPRVFGCGWGRAAASMGKVGALHC